MSPFVFSTVGFCQGWRGRQRQDGTPPSAPPASRWLANSFPPSGVTVSSGRPASALTSTFATSAELRARALPPTSRRDALSVMVTWHAGVGPTTVSSSQSPSLERASASRGRSETSWSTLILPRVSSRPRLGRLPPRRRRPRTLSAGAARGGSGSPALTAR